MEVENTFGVVDYLVFVAVLAISAAIGIYYGCFGSKQKTAEEFLMANRQMSYFPVAISLMCSFISAILFIGFPVEVYLFGGQFFLFGFAFIPVTAILIYFYVPVYFNLQVTSAYQYLEMRFSKKARVLVTCLGIFNLLFYMAVCVYGPSLALEQVTGTNSRILNAAILTVCIFYSSIGGLKTVLWSDTFQGILMIVSIVAVVIKGIYDVGGWCTVWERNSNALRTNFFNFDVDPRTRYTFWSVMFGAMFTFLPIHATSQGQVQRYVSLPSMESCKKALFISMIGHFVLLFLACLCGFTAFAFYFDCDPITSKRVSRPDQLMPIFVLESLGNIPGLPGLFVAGVTAASLSSVSSGVNAIAAIMTYDVVKKHKPLWTDERLSFISKMLSVLTGCLVYALIFAVEQMGSILPAALSIMNTIGGPVLGIFTLGMFFPWANTRGAIMSMVVTVCFMGSVAVGVYVAATQKLLPNQMLPLSRDGCINPATANTTFFIPKNITDLTISSGNTTRSPPIISMTWKEKSVDDSGLIQFLSMSYMYQSGFGFALTIILGLLFSYIFSRPIFNQFSFKESRRNRREGTVKAVKVELMSPPMVKLWNFIFPQQMKEWIIMPDTKMSGDHALSILKPE